MNVWLSGLEFCISVMANSLNLSIYMLVLEMASPPFETFNVIGIQCRYPIHSQSRAVYWKESRTSRVQERGYTVTTQKAW